MAKKNVADALSEALGFFADTYPKYMADKEDKKRQATKDAESTSYNQWLRDFQERKLAADTEAANTDLMYRSFAGDQAQQNAMELERLRQSGDAAARADAITNSLRLENTRGANDLARIQKEWDVKGGGKSTGFGVQNWDDAVKAASDFHKADVARLTNDVTGGLAGAGYDYITNVQDKELNPEDPTSLRAAALSMDEKPVGLMPKIDSLGMALGMAPMDWARQRGYFGAPAADTAGTGFDMATAAAAELAKRKAKKQGAGQSVAAQ